MMTKNGKYLFFFNDTATTEIYTSFPTRRSSDLNGMYKIWFARNYRTWVANTLLLDNALATMGAGLDRKSTRLNSSHANISYAVFCLKKNHNSYTLYLHHYHGHSPSLQLLQTLRL